MGGEGRGARHRRARPRRAAVGELVQWDSSDHAWLEKRSPGRLMLVTLIDDASSRVQYARFVEQDNGVVNREAVITYLRSSGGRWPSTPIRRATSSRDALGRSGAEGGAGGPADRIHHPAWADGTRCRTDPVPLSAGQGRSSEDSGRPRTG